jgi:large subunit ribosomal protein L30
MADKLKITWVRGQIAAQRRHRRTIRALGLHRLHQTIEKDDSPAVRGMIRSVEYMLKIEEVAG